MLDQWQNRLLPFMVLMLIAAAILFSVATLWQYGRMSAWVTAPSPAPTDTMWTDRALRPDTFAERLALAQRRAEYALEGDVIRRRYEQNNEAIATRLWARFMGFLIGMIMAIVGSAFILGKLSDAGNELGGGGGGYTLGLKSASPGIVLATLGTVLIGLTLTVQVTVQTKDVPVYFYGTLPAGFVAAAPDPQPLDPDATAALDGAARDRSGPIGALLANMGSGDP